VHSASVNPTDWKQRKGTLSTIFPLKLPCILGIDLSGRVVRSGDDSPYSEGDEVFGRQTLDRMRELNGSYAEYAIVDSADLYRKPARLSHDEAAAVPHACLAAYAALAHVGQLVSKVRASRETWWPTD
jgi:NADPH:quinone reductase-like Zn-dependent oxidoreductase